MTDELKPVHCGCGGEAKVELLPFEVWEDRWDASASQYLVRCDRCGMTTRLHDTEAEAIQAWNRAMSADAYKSSATERTAKVFQSIDGYRCAKCFYRFETTAIPQHCPHCGARLEWE